MQLNSANFCVCDWFSKKTVLDVEIDSRNPCGFPTTSTWKHTNHLPRKVTPYIFGRLSRHSYQFSILKQFKKTKSVRRMSIIVSSLIVQHDFYCFSGDLSFVLSEKHLPLLYYSNLAENKKGMN